MHFLLIAAKQELQGILIGLRGGNISSINHTHVLSIFLHIFFRSKRVFGTVGYRLRTRVKVILEHVLEQKIYALEMIRRGGGIEEGKSGYTPLSTRILLHS